MKSRKLKKRYPHLFDYTSYVSSGDKVADFQWHKGHDKKKFENLVLYVLQKGGPMEIGKLLDLLYLSFRYYIREHGMMMWHDVWIAKAEGPRPFFGERCIKEMIDKKKIYLTLNKIE